MNESFTTGMGIQVDAIGVAIPRPGLAKSELRDILEDLGNPILRETEAGFVCVDTAAEREAAEGEFVWACDFCGAYSVNKQTTIDHELTCERNPDGESSS